MTDGYACPSQMLAVGRFFDEVFGMDTTTRTLPLVYLVIPSGNGEHTRQPTRHGTGSKLHVSAQITRGDRPLDLSF